MDGVSGVSSESLPVSGGCFKQCRKRRARSCSWVAYKITGETTATLENASSTKKFKKNDVDIKDRNAESVLSEDEAARVIQKAVTNWLDKKTLKNDFENVGLPENMEGSAFEALRSQSAINLATIKKELGELTTTERNILSIIQSAKMRFRHQTCLHLDKDRLIMISPSLRQAKGMHSNSNSNSNSKYYEHHDHYLFYSVEFAHKFSNEEPLKTKQANGDHGPIAYLLSKQEVEARPCLITLCDSFVERVYFQYFCDGFPTPKGNTKGLYKFYNHHKFFIPDHLLSAMGLYLIENIRMLKKDTLCYANMIIEKICASSSENNNIQEVLNSLMEPEAKVPRMLKSSDFCKKQFRRYTIAEACKSQKIDELLSYLNNKNDCVGILAEILDSNFVKEKQLKPIFEKIFSMVGRDDLPAIKEAYAKISKWSKPGKPADLAYYLCYQWNDDARKLLLDKGIIKLSDPLFRTDNDYKATNMKSA